MEGSKVIEELRAFVAERDWAQFHTEANLAKGVSIEAAELLENYQWSDDADLQSVRDELGDVLTYCFLLADKLGENPEDLIRQKLRKTIEKYPVEKSKGRSTKHDKL